MGNTPVRYERPRLEIEYDQACLVAEGCCRFVRVVLRLCGVPLHKQVRLEVIVERMRVVKDGLPQEEYTERPMYLRLAQPFEHYCEGKVEVLARGHPRETGTVRMTMSSPKGTILSQAVLRFEGRQSKPLVEHASGLASLTFVSTIRSDALRESLRGRLPFLELSPRTPIAAPSGEATRATTTLWDDNA
jgi:hypothetical protein